MEEPRRADTPLESGTVTFVFTDIEGSTRLWEDEPERMRSALASHDTISRAAVEAHRGVVVKMTGDGVHAAFGDSLDALAATVDLQRALADPGNTCGVTLRVRCGLHAGVVERRNNDYFGSPVNRAARIMSAAHGGQVLLSQAVADEVRRRLPAVLSLRDLGRVRLKDLSTPEHVYQVVHPQLRQEFPALRSLETTPNNLPQQATSFIGRQKELIQLQRLLAKTRLLTLTGSGGCGKTRLGLQLAADALERYPDGAWLVELAPLADPGLLPQTVATVLGLKEVPGMPINQTLSAHLKDKRLLLLFDNCEHLLHGCAQLVDALLRECPHVTIVASSREALGIGGEQSYRVPSLSLPDPKQAHTPTSVAAFEAVQLFSDRASLSRPDFQITSQNATALVSICHQLDGIPLAIELAAARVRLLSVEEIHQKLDQRFRLLTGGSRTALPRQQTLRSLIDWSYDPLQEAEKLLLQRLSVFVGGWTLEAAASVCAGAGVADSEILDLLTSLSDKSLVLTEQANGPSRYRLLETVRQYAGDKLREGRDERSVRGRHCDYFLALANEAQPHLEGVAHTKWMRRLEDEHDNLRASLHWSMMEVESVAALGFCAALFRFWLARGYLAEGREWCARALAKDLTEQPTRERSIALNVAGGLAYHQGDYVAARASYEESLAIRRQSGDRKGIAFSLNNLGLVACDQGDFAAARTLLEESLAIKRELGDRRGIATSLNNLGNVAYDQGNLEVSRPLYEESLGIAREVGDQVFVADLLGSLGNVAMHQRDFATARTLNEQSLAIKRELGHRQSLPNTLNSLAALACEQGDFSRARALLEEALAIGRELGDRMRMAASLEVLAEVFAALGSPLRAASAWGAAKSLRAAVGAPLPPKERPDYERHVAEARAAVGDSAAFDRAFEEGHAMTLEHAIGVALKA